MALPGVQDMADISVNEPRIMRRRDTHHTVWKRYKCLMLSILLVSTMPLQLSGTMTGSEFERGVESFKQGHYEEAKSILENFLKTHPNHPEALYYLGKSVSGGVPSQKYFRSLWINHPTHALAAEALYTICQYHYAKGYYVTAGTMFRDLVRTFPESEYADDAFYWSASCHLAAEHPDSALNVWQTFLTAYPKSDLYDWATLGIGDALFALGRYKEACSEYVKIVDSPFSETQKNLALYQLGRCYDLLGDTTSARECDTKLVEQFPQSYERVLIEAKKKKEDRSTLVASEVYTIQVGAFAHKENAIRLQGALSDKGYDVTIVSKSINNGKLLHAVQVGSYASIEDAHTTAERLEKEEGFQPQIVPKE